MKKTPYQLRLVKGTPDQGYKLMITAPPVPPMGVLMRNVRGEPLPPPRPPLPPPEDRVSLLVKPTFPGNHEMRALADGWRVRYGLPRPYPSPWWVRAFWTILWALVRLRWVRLYTQPAQQWVVAFREREADKAMERAMGMDFTLDDTDSPPPGPPPRPWVPSPSHETRSPRYVGTCAGCGGTGVWRHYTGATMPCQGCNRKPPPRVPTTDITPCAGCKTYCQGCRPPPPPPPRLKDPGIKVRW